MLLILFVLLIQYNVCHAESIPDCADDWVNCGNGKCVSHIWRCDGDNDCENSKDEENCESGIPPRTCDSGMFQCVADGLCVTNVWRCDGEHDCKDGSDEQNCSNMTNCVGFRCSDQHCIPSSWKCDGKNDCPDKSDEKFCPKAKVCNDSEFTCKNGNCLNIAKICDGKKDCSDGSDEAEHCGDSCTNSTCAHKCRVTPKGPECYCNEGYKIGKDNKSCFDVDECKTEGFCSQTCTNLIGSYKCSCKEGYELKNRSCKAEGPEPLLIFSTMHEIRGIYLRSKRYFPLQKAIVKAAAVDVDPISSRLYWIEISNKSAVYSARIDGSGFGVVLHNGLMVPEGIAVDYNGRNLYFTDSGLKQILVCKMDDSMCYALHKENVDKPRAIAVDPPEGMLYWSDWGANTTGIYRSGMDGSRRILLVSKNITWPNGIAIDHTTNRLYWVDGSLTTIEYINLDGTNRRTLIKDGVFHPFSLAVFEDNLFWSDWDSYSLETCNKFTGHKMTVMARESGKHIMGVHVYHPVLAREANKPCWSHPCSHMCLIAPMNSYRCVCPQGYTMSSNGVTCIIDDKYPMLLVNDESSIYHIRPEAIGSIAVSTMPSLHLDKMSRLTYDWTTKTLFVADMELPAIYAVNMSSWIRRELVRKHLVSPEDIAFDWMSKILYWTDSSKGTVEVISPTSLRSATIVVDLVKPTAIALAPNVGSMFVSTTGENPTIFMFDLDGRNQRILIAQFAKSITVHPLSSTLYWADSKSSIIASIDYKTKRDPKILKTGVTNILSLAVNEKHLYWTDSTHHVTHFMLQSGGLSYYISLPGTKGLVARKVTYEAPKSSRAKGFLGRTPCMDNGGCSYLCLTSPAKQRSWLGSPVTRTCICPYGKVLSSDNKTCINKDCTSEEFQCVSSKQCVPQEFVCDDMKDCDDGSDEKCEEPIKKCPASDFQCHNGKCIMAMWKCDGRNDCGDHSDETSCPTKATCLMREDHMQCGDGECIPVLWKCDGDKDCKDGSDEVNCNQTACKEDQIRCEHGRCIPKSWACDGAPDCYDGTDEENCPKVRTCSFKQFTCGDGKCIDKIMICDKRADCKDGSDERNCTYVDKSCKANSFACNDGSCIYENEKCDGYKDCSEGDDEINCTRTETQCSSQEHFCVNSSRCISSRWICDGDDDCGDGSDEDSENCTKMSQTTQPSVELSLECEEYTCTTNGECVPWSKLCDGDHDCEDLTDEGPLCSKACINNGGCSHQCLKTPLGAKCLCDAGYKLLADNITCDDVNECLIPGSCSHYCENTRGGFKCSCAEGYFLEFDNKRCRAGGGIGQLVYLLDDQIRRIDMSGGSENVYVLLNSTGVKGFDFDAATQNLYWTEWGEGTLNSYHPATRTNRIVSSSLFRPSYLQWNWISHNMYYANDEGNIMGCDKDAVHCAQLLHAAPHICAFTLAPDEGYMFWGVWAVAIERRFGKLERADLDGSNRMQIVSDKIVWPTGITVDHILKAIYWVDMWLNVVETSDFYGHGRRIVASKHVDKPYAITIFEDYVYFANWNYDSIRRCHKVKSNDCNDLSTGNMKTEVLMVMHEARQLKGKNNCRNHKCPQICFPTRNGHVCKCSDDYLEVNSTCELRTTVAPTTVKPECPKNYCMNGASCKVEDDAYICQCPEFYEGETCDVKVALALKAPSNYSWVAAVVLSLAAISGVIALAFVCKKKRLHLNKMRENVAVTFRKNGFGRKSGRLVVDTDDDCEMADEMMIGNKGDMTPNSFRNPVFGKKPRNAGSDMPDGEFKRWPSFDSCDSAFVSECQTREGSQLCINETSTTVTRTTERIVQFFRRL